ncbi:MAG: adenylosuccinate synthetase [Planctomycetes bacterium]|nr:adenylosuccinate synthetase [Planctomycetota bacterium]
MTGGDAWIVCGLGFGDEGKGTVTDFLARALGARMVVRWNGGPQAGHNVVTPDGTWHCFAQFGAGTLVPGTRTILAPGMLVEPENLAVEAEALRAKGAADAGERLAVDPSCALVTPMHKMVGQMLEVARGGRAVGSCGLGVGQAAADREAGTAVTVGDLFDGGAGESRLTGLAEERLARAEALARAAPSEEMARLLAYFRGRCRPEALFDAYRAAFERLGVRVARAEEGLRRAFEGGPVLFEGAQGALLDARFGFSPYVTKTRTTAEDAVALAGRGCAGRGAQVARVRKLGVLRAYGHRHGPGPFVTEDERLAERFADPHNRANRWQGPFRVGQLDLVALRYGIVLQHGVEALAVTGLDRLTGLPTIRLCASYEYEGDLRELDPHFEWSRLGEGRARLHAFRAPAGGGAAKDWRATPVGSAHALPDGALARILRRCRPLDWVELRGWAEEVSGARCRADLPAAARAFLELLESEQGLGARVGLVSMGPGATAKWLEIG